MELDGLEQLKKVFNSRDKRPHTNNCAYIENNKTSIK